MTRKGFPSTFGIAGLAFALFAAPQAHAAATANFQGLCTWNAGFTQFTCTFDANRPASAPTACPGSFVWKHLWDFDDGSTLLTGNPVATHAFPDRADRVVSLKAICWNGETPVTARHVCTNVGTPGCLQVNGTWN
jgi:hypothetical protein